MKLWKKIATAIGIAGAVISSPAQSSPVNENWTGFWRETAEGNWIIIVDQWLATPEASHFSNWAVIEMKFPQDRVFHGMPEPALMDEIGLLQDRLDAAVEGVKGRFIGAQTGFGIRKIWYGATNVDLVAFIRPLLQSGIIAEVTINASDILHAAWLLPSHMESQLSANENLVRELSKSGDVSSTQRPIMHWIFLKETTRLEDLKTQLLSLGYQIEEQSTEVLRFSKKSDALLDSLNEQTRLLNRLCDDHKCTYDGWETPIVRH